MCYILKVNGDKATLTPMKAPRRDVKGRFTGVKKNISAAAKTGVKVGEMSLAARLVCPSCGAGL